MKELDDVIWLRDQLNITIREMRTKKYAIDKEYSDNTLKSIVAAINSYQKHCCWQMRNAIGIHADHF